MLYGSKRNGPNSYTLFSGLLITAITQSCFARRVELFGSCAGRALRVAGNLSSEACESSSAEPICGSKLTPKMHIRVNAQVNQWRSWVTMEIGSGSDQITIRALDIYGEACL